MIIIKSEDQNKYADRMSTEDIVTEDQNKAIKKLNKLKVSEIMITDGFSQGGHKCLFDSLWWYALHELDLFNEGQDTELTKRSAISTRKWLKETQQFTIEHKELDF